MPFFENIIVFPAQSSPSEAARDEPYSDSERADVKPFKNGWLCKWLL